MKAFIFLILFLSFSNLFAQEDELKETLQRKVEFEQISDTVIDLSQFKLSNKVVIAEYGKVRMFFNQQDYFNSVSIEDTVIVTPKYFDHYRITELLTFGEGMVFSRSEKEFQKSIITYNQQVGSMLMKNFKLNDGTAFFSDCIAYGLEPEWKTMKFDSTFFNAAVSETPSPKRCAFTTKDFEFPDEHADLNDKKAVKIREYFPMKPSQHLVFDYRNSYGEKDTIICKTAILDDLEIFYFAEKRFGSKLVSVGTSMFGNGLYFYSNDTLYRREVEYEEDIFLSKEEDMFGHGPEEKMMLLPPTMVPGDSIVFEDDFCTKSYIYLKKENLTIGNTEYKDCIKLKIYSHYDDTIYNE